MHEISHNTLPQAVQTILEQVQQINQKIDSLPATPPPLDEDRFVDVNEIRKIIFPQWKKQTLYNKCCLGEVPHSRIGARLMFNVKECRQWRDSQLQQGRIKALSQIDEEALALFEQHKKEGRI